MQFRQLFESKTGFNPFSKVTIASACSHDLRLNCMIKNSIASEPLHGWHVSVDQSVAALEWLHWQDYQLRTAALAQLTEEDLEAHDLMALAYADYEHPSHRHYIQHGRKQGEFKIPETRYHADGYAKDTNTLYEFLGCYWHGCPTCFPERGEFHKLLLNRCMQDVYDKTQMCFNTLREKGYNLVTIWECQWEKQKQENPDIQAYVANLDFVEPLNPRDAFAGGRTNAIKLYHAVKPNEKIHYVDYTSLYPWVNKTQRYPVGHPEFISNPGTTDVTRYFGFIKCKLTAPYGLYHPVLPSKEGGKLTFPLCGACAREQLAKPMLERSAVCHHSEEQRTMIGTWCTPEVEKAVELGYDIQHIYEVWHFKESREGLFADYVNTWLKVKQEVSGWPSWCTTEALKQQYIRDYETKENIKLEYDKIVKNDGLRSVAKNMLNNMWGKFGQNVNKTQIKEFDDPVEFHEFLDQDSVEVQQVSVVSEKVIEVYYKHAEHDIPVDPNLNILWPLLPRVGLAYIYTKHLKC